MNLSVIRRIDEYVGPLVGVMLLVILRLKKLAGNWSEVSPSAEAKHVLITKFFGFGSLLLASPTIRSMKTRYPKARITIFTTTENRRICEMLPGVDNVVCLNIGSVSKFVSSFVRALLQIRNIRPDVVIDFEFLTNFSAIVTLLIRIMCANPATYGFNAPLAWRNRAFDRTTVFDHSVHVMQAFLKTVNTLDEHETVVDGGAIDLSVESNSLRRHANSEFADRLLRENAALGDCEFLVCMNVNAGSLCLLRRWPPAHFKDLITRLLRRPDLGIVLIGGPDDAPYVGEILAQLPDDPRIVDVSGKTSPEELIGLFIKCDLLVTNDSGPLHLAYVLTLPTISFFGPETPRLYGPVGDDHVALYVDLWCSPCINIYNSKMTKCRDNVCLQRITPESVEAIIKDKYLAAPPRAADLGKAAHR